MVPVIIITMYLITVWYIVYCVLQAAVRVAAVTIPTISTDPLTADAYVPHNLTAQVINVNHKCGYPTDTNRNSNYFLYIFCLPTKTSRRNIFSLFFFLYRNILQIIRQKVRIVKGLVLSYIYFMYISTVHVTYIYIYKQSNKTG